MKTYISPWPESCVLPDFPRSLVILGATGSIGDSALKVVDQHPEQFSILALAGAKNIGKLVEIAKKYRPAHLGVLDEAGASELAALLPAGYKPKIHVGPKGYETLAALPEADLILSTIVGAAGFLPTLSAARAGKMIALANKESLVIGGHLIREECQKTGAVILPVDSEHNALFQGMAGHPDGISRLILTASGGPFREKDAAFLQQVTPKQALAHPNWDMGAKISIDSATLMNKGLEVIEACHLYGLPVSDVSVVVHPQSIVHSLVEYVDGSQLGHLGLPDMQIPIAHCLFFPKRMPLSLPKLNLASIGSLTFEEPKPTLFPCLRLAQEAFAAGPAHPVVLNAVNEVAVANFLKGNIRFLDIPAMIEDALGKLGACDTSTPEALLALDEESRKRARMDWSL